MDVLEKLRKLLADRGWTDYRLAQMSGLHESTISNIYRRNNVPKGGFFAADTMEPGNKIYHVPGGSAAETVKAAVNLHAWVPVVVERADAHPVPVYFDSITLRSLPCGDGLLHGFKYVQ